MPTIRGRDAKDVVLLFVCGTVLFCLLGCASCPIEYTRQSQLPSDERLVCGRVMALRGGQPIIWKPGVFASTGMSVEVMPEAGKVGIPYRLVGDGRFCWHLRPGRYVISGFQWGNAAYFESGRIWAEFTVPAAGSQTCLGTLVIRLTRYHYSYDVLDGCDTLVADLVASQLKVGDEWHTQLLELEPSK